MGLTLFKQVYVELWDFTGGAIAHHGRSVISTIALLYYEIKLFTIKYCYFKVT